MGDIARHKRKPERTATIREAAEHRAVTRQQIMQARQGRFQFCDAKMLEHIKCDDGIKHRSGGKLDFVQRPKMDILPRR